jgi:hypothetical protein
MKRNAYVRLVSFPLNTSRKTSKPLARLAKTAKAGVFLEGRLLDDIKIGAGIKLRADYRNGSAIREDVTCPPIIRIEDGFALTQFHVYQFLRIPSPCRGGNSPDSSLETTGQNGTRFLTTSQRAALKELLGMAELVGDDGIYGGIKIRVRPLISGYSGSGKTTVVDHLRLHLSEKLGKTCPLLKIPAPSWILHGARAEPHTLILVRDFLREHVTQKPSDQKANKGYQGAQAVILVDEIDKLTSRNGMSDAWYRSAVGELICLADMDSRLEANGWTKVDITALKNTLLVGVGAFLDGLEPGSDQDKSSHLEAISSHCALPDEVRLRFASRVLYIDSPNEQDYREAFSRLYDDLGLPLPSPAKLNELVVAAQEAKAGLRFVEEHVGDLLIAHPHLRRRREPPAPETAAAPTEKTKQSSLTVIPKARYVRYVNQLHKQMRELEAHLVHVQALFALHEAQFAKVRGDVTDPRTNKAITATDLQTDFSSVLQGLRYIYCTNDENRTKTNEDLWLAGHRVQSAIWSAIMLEPDFLNEEMQLALFTEVYARLSRLLRAINHIASVRAEGDD